MSAAEAPAGATFQAPIDPELPVPQDDLDLQTFIQHVKIDSNAILWYTYVQNIVIYKTKLKAFAEDTREESNMEDIRHHIRK